MYAQLTQFGNSNINSLPVYNNDPLTYCIGESMSQAFNHGSNGSTYGQNSPSCQVYLAQRCAQGWDGICEYASQSTANPIWSQAANTMSGGNKEVLGLTSGQNLIRNTAQEKYRSKMYNCDMKVEQFDPLNPASPYIAYYIGQNCVPQYSVDPKTIDNDRVMNLVLDQPSIAMQMLMNIKNTMIRDGTFTMLAGTRLGRFYGLPDPNKPATGYAAPRPPCTPNQYLLR